MMPKLNIKKISLKDLNSKIYRFIRSGSYCINGSSTYLPNIINRFVILQILLIHLKIDMYIIRGKQCIQYLIYYLILLPIVKYM